MRMGGKDGGLDDIVVALSDSMVEIGIGLTGEDET